MTQHLTGNVAITKYTPYTDNLIADDAFITISPGASMVLTGDNLFEDDTLVGRGIWRIRGPLFAYQVNLQQHVFTVNNSIVTQTGFVSTGRAGTDDLTVIRNLPSAIWDINADVNIGPSADFSRFVNLGLLEKTGSSGVSEMASILNSVGTVDVASGELKFTGLRARFTGTVEGAGTIEVTTRAVLDNVNVSVAQFNADLAIIRNKAAVSGAFDFYTVVLQNGELDLTGSADSLLPSVVKGTGLIVVKGQAKLTNLTLYQHTELDNKGTITVVGDAVGKSLYQIQAPASGSPALIHNFAGAKFSVPSGPITSSELTALSSGVSMAFSGWSGDKGSGALKQFINDGAYLQTGGWFETNMAFENNGTLTVEHSGDPTIGAVSIFRDNVSGGGTITVGAGGAAIFEAGASALQTIQLGNDRTRTPVVLGITDLADFHAVIAGFGSGSAPETIAVAGWTYDGFSPAGGGVATNSLLFEHNGAEASLTLSGSLNLSRITIHAGSGGTGAIITYT